MRTSAAITRRGTLLVVVLGLVTIFMSLLLAITVRVFNGTKNGTAFQQTVQAYLMMIAARKVIAAGGGGTAATYGDDASLFNLCGRPYINTLGWFRIQDATHLMAVGGSSVAGNIETPIVASHPLRLSVPKSTANSGDDQRNAYEIRLCYLVTGANYDLQVVGTSYW